MRKTANGSQAACPLFWTLGASQVGKGAIVGWREVLAPALRDDEAVLLWMFDGRLCELLRPGTIVIAETYPTECYGWFFSEPLKGKADGSVWARDLPLSRLTSCLPVIHSEVHRGRQDVR